MCEWFNKKKKKPTIVEAIKACDDWWNSIEGVQGDEVIVADFGRLTVHLCGSEEAFQREYCDVHGKMPSSPVFGLFHASGAMGSPHKAVYHLYVRFKRDSAGVEYIAPWALQHELHHAIDNWLYLAGRDEDMSNPDELV